MGSTNSSALGAKFPVPDPQLTPSCSSQVDEEKTDPGESTGIIGLQLRFVDKKFFEDVKTNGDEMKRSAGPSDRAFVDDLLHSRFIDPELSAIIVQEHVQRVVDARKSFSEEIQAARGPIQGCAAQLQNVTEISSSQIEMLPEASEVQQWLTESTTSDNMLSPSDIKESHHIQSETTPS